MAIDDKRIYVPLTNIYGKKAADGTYSLSALDLKSLNDNLYNIVKKLQGGLTVSDLTSATVEYLSASSISTENLYAIYGDIADLTVDRLITADKVQRYKDGDTSDINYIHIEDQAIQFKTGTTDGSTEQHTDRDGNLLYWYDADMTGMSTEVTAYPVTVYAYTELVKMQLLFEYDDAMAAYVPKIVLGAGTGTGDNGKTFIYKGVDGFYIDYRNSVTGASTIFKITDDGIDFSQFPTITYAEETILQGLVQLWVQADEPTGAKTNDLWVDTDADTGAGKAYFKVSENAYQKWTDYPDSPILSAEYPYQLVVYGTVGVTQGTYLAYSTEQMYLEEWDNPTLYGGQINTEAESNTIYLYVLSESVWVDAGTTGNIAVTENNGEFIIESNRDIPLLPPSAAEYSGVYFSKSTTSEQDGGVVWNPIVCDSADIPYDNTDSGLSANKVKAALDELANSVGGTSAIATVCALTVAGWSANSQTGTATGVTASNIAIVAPDPADQSTYVAAGIICTAQGTDTLTFTCATTPTSDIDVNVVILEASA